jgi:hypothetical protein
VAVHATLGDSILRPNWAAPASQLTCRVYGFGRDTGI